MHKPSKDELINFCLRVHDVSRILFRLFCKVLLLSYVLCDILQELLYIALKVYKFVCDCFRYFHRMAVLRKQYSSEYGNSIKLDVA